jgi:hypothetical protein
MRGKRDLVWTDVAVVWRRGEPAAAFPWSSAENIRENPLIGLLEEKAAGLEAWPKSRLGSVYQAPLKNQRKFISNNPPLFNF